MLTREGWTVAVGSVALVVAGRLLGIFEFFLLGAAGVALVVAAAAAMSLLRLRLDVERRVHPRRVHAGDDSRVELRVRNMGARRTPLLSLRDPVGDDRSAKVLLAPVPPGEAVRAAYRLPTEQRGVLRVGPLTVRVTDPFGLAAVEEAGAPASELTVFPAIDDIVPLPHSHGDDPHGGAVSLTGLSPSGEDFYALREYERGDDLRRVHWGATARHDELMVRQEEMPWQGRATILLDVRGTAHTPETLERAVSAAASIVAACRQRRFLLRLAATDGTDSGFAAGSAHVEAIMERLAAVRATYTAKRLHAMAGTLSRSGAAGSLVAILGGRSLADLEVVARLRPAFTATTTVVFLPGPADARTVAAAGAADAGSSGGRGRGTLLVGPGTPFAAVWDQAMGRRPRSSAQAVTA